jgi:dihydroorotate dehydrogenase (NAD+) catalytic subunit
MTAVDMTTRVGAVTLPNPILTASGTSGYGDELGRFFDIATLGALVVKSMSCEPWPGNPPPRVTAAALGMINAVGLHNHGVESWLEHELPRLERIQARVVASIWGRTVEDYAKAATMLADASAAVVAVEVNVSCPNIEDRRTMFAHSATATHDAVAATASCRRPRWAKLSPNVTDLCEIAAAARQAGAEALTLINTVMGMTIDVETRRGFAGGLSGPPIRPVAVRAVYECHRAFPDTSIVGVGGVMGARDVIELMLAGASAVEVGTASFADPRACARIVKELSRWCRRHRIEAIRDVVGAVDAGAGAVLVEPEGTRP